MMTMDSFDKCFVAQVLEPLTVIDLLPASPQGPPPHSQRISNHQDLKALFENPKNAQYVCRYISICQRTSWAPLQVTRPMLDLIASQHGLGSSFYDVASCFYERNLELEEAFCVPFSLTQSGDWTEISYSLRYPHYKESDEEWVVRQTGIYHHFNTVTRQNLFVTFNPNPKTVVDQLAQDLLLHRHHEILNKSVFWLHDVLFSTYPTPWRRYIASLESELLPIANTTFSSYIDKSLRVGHDDLGTLVSVERRLFHTTALLGSTLDALDELATSLEGTDASQLKGKMQNYQRQCAGNFRAATYLQQRARSTAQLLADTLSLRDQVIAKQQGASMLQLNKSAVFITTLTLVYLPASFVATFFGMNFFDMDQPNNRIVGTPMVWIFFVGAIALTGVTFAFYYWLLQEHDSAAFRRLAPKVRITADWKAPFEKLKKRVSYHPGSSEGNGLPPGIEFRKLSV